MASQMMTAASMNPQSTKFAPSVRGLAGAETEATIREFLLVLVHVAYERCMEKGMEPMTLPDMFQYIMDHVSQDFIHAGGAVCPRMVQEPRPDPHHPPSLPPRSTCCVMYAFISTRL